MANSKVTLTNKKYLAEAKMRNHFVVIDEPISSGGGDNGATPVEYLLTAIGGCVSMTLRMYADRKGWDVGEITVNVFQTKENNQTYLSEEISFEKEITEDQKRRLLIFAGKCPVARMVKGETPIATKII
ncbi:MULTISPECIES: OsmC family protein [unclassified Polaribacter]|uniref:OsmC family protein n=1 Tax=unclassified Polaribacter TaxID=196858 RepID=UPI0011BDB45C|nr:MULTISPECIES: OsmC family protein [unclassified Polaribacter]TXD51458.1 OsmC family protein [Polaribacter sp. IC063]TXD61814.1 OsmC family protein [Polaribacter sp. IC066]